MRFKLVSLYIGLFTLGAIFSVGPSALSQVFYSNLTAPSEEYFTLKGLKSINSDGDFVAHSGIRDISTLSQLSVICTDPLYETKCENRKDKYYYAQGSKTCGYAVCNNYSLFEKIGNDWNKIGRSPSHTNLNTLNINFPNEPVYKVGGAWSEGYNPGAVDSETYARVRSLWVNHPICNIPEGSAHYEFCPEQQAHASSISNLKKAQANTVLGNGVANSEDGSVIQLACLSFSQHECTKFVLQEQSGNHWRNITPSFLAKNQKTILESLRKINSNDIFEPLLMRQGWNWVDHAQLVSRSQYQKLKSQMLQWVSAQELRNLQNYKALTLKYNFNNTKYLPGSSPSEVPETLVLMNQQVATAFHFSDLTSKQSICRFYGYREALSDPWIDADESSQSEIALVMPAAYPPVPKKKDYVYWEVNIDEHESVRIYKSDYHQWYSKILYFLTCVGKKG